MARHTDRDDSGQGLHYRRRPWSDQASLDRFRALACVMSDALAALSAEYAPSGLPLIFGVVRRVPPGHSSHRYSLLSLSQLADDRLTRTAGLPDGRLVRDSGAPLPYRFLEGEGAPEFQHDLESFCASASNRLGLPDGEFMILEWVVEVAAERFVVARMHKAALSPGEFTLRPPEERWEL